MHTYIGEYMRLSLLHDDMRRDNWSLTETMSQILHIHVILIHGKSTGGITIWTFKLTTLVGLYVLTIPLFALN
jgi:hypothetical protein